MEYNQRTRFWVSIGLFAALGLAFVGGLAAATTEVKEWPFWLKTVVWIATPLLLILALLAERKRGRLEGVLNQAVTTARSAVRVGRKKKAERIVLLAAQEDGFPGLVEENDTIHGLPEMHEQIKRLVPNDRKAAEQVIRSVTLVAAQSRRYDLAADVQLQMKIYNDPSLNNVQEVLQRTASRYSAQELLTASLHAIQPLVFSLTLGIAMATNRANDPRATAAIWAEARKDTGRLAGMIDNIREAANGASPATRKIIIDTLEFTKSYCEDVHYRISSIDSGDFDVSRTPCEWTLQGYREVRSHE